VSEYEDLVQTIYHALRSDYLALAPLPKGTRNIECARDERRAKVIAAAIQREREKWVKMHPDTIQQW
jgi:hypothetical protein